VSAGVASRQEIPRGPAVAYRLDRGDVCAIDERTDDESTDVGGVDWHMSGYRTKQRLRISSYSRCTERGMSREPRNIRPGAVYHLISRFVDRDWFITREHEREAYLSLLGRALSDSDWRCLSYAIMSNHVHHGVIAGGQPLDEWIRRVHSPFADAMNKSHNRIGSVFVRGPKDYEVPGDRVGAVIAYIHNNPVRAKVVSAASQSTWTSHRAYVGLADRPPWLHVDEGLARSGFASPEEFDAWVTLAPGHPNREKLEQRIATWEREERGLPRRRNVPTIDPVEVVAVVANELDVPLEQLRSGRKLPTCALARRATVRCAASLGINGVAVARALAISQQRVSSILAAPSDVDDVVARVIDRLADRKNP
jgi:hypothetical protein